MTALYIHACCSASPVSLCHVTSHRPSSNRHVTAAGLEVILEEPEDEYVTSSEEEEEQQESPQSRSLHSLEGSEGIGSAEGDSGSNASVESSSGVHSPGESVRCPSGIRVAAGPGDNQSVENSLS